MNIKPPFGDKTCCKCGKPAELHHFTVPRTQYFCWSCFEGIMNTYEYEFYKKCPNNDAIIRYTLTIESSETIMVESIVEFVDCIDGFHEMMADDLHSKFGGKQTLNAMHHGVQIRTIRK